ncbi:unnamed protein product [Cuscuta epithymum]|uniref:Uncharacterized protein n=1 Tax=Cuscuta epithymum TaxID=186058 RepID=A0AAV0EJ48_9ASTE|nr:unnamed protein product [Cuscuta epithymum]
MLRGSRPFRDYDAGRRMWVALSSSIGGPSASTCEQISDPSKKRARGCSTGLQSGNNQTIEPVGGKNRGSQQWKLQAVEITNSICVLKSKATKVGKGEGETFWKSDLENTEYTCVVLDCLWRWVWVNPKFLEFEYGVWIFVFEYMNQCMVPNFL